MADPNHLAVIKDCAAQDDGWEAWGAWRTANPTVDPDISDGELRSCHLSHFDLTSAIIEGADFSGANLSRAILSNIRRGANSQFVHAKLDYAVLTKSQLMVANLESADLSSADLTGCNLEDAVLAKANLRDAAMDHALLNHAVLDHADLRGASLAEAQLEGAFLTSADLTRANLQNANLREADVGRALMIETDLRGADLTGAQVFGASVWNAKLEKTKQKNLVLSLPDGRMRVDNLAAAQFLYLQMTYKQFGEVIDAITMRSVLLLGRFTTERKAILEALQDWLQKKSVGMHAWIFDFAPPESQTLIGTAAILANLSRFVIADVTDSRSVPYELQALVPTCRKPFAVVIQTPETPAPLLRELGELHKDRLIGIFSYKDVTDLEEIFEQEILPALQRAARSLSG